MTRDTATVFVVDDETSVRQALTEMLSVFGYNVEAYPSAEGLLQSLDPREIGCIVADVRMPGMDGIELVQELSRRDSANPVVVISGHADIAMAVAAIKAGAEDFIEKPIDDSRLVAAINRGLARRFEHQQRQETIQDLWARFDRLTPREVQVFDLVVEGHTSASIANLLTDSRKLSGTDHGKDGRGEYRRPGAERRAPWAPGAMRPVARHAAVDVVCLAQRRAAFP